MTREEQQKCEYCHEPFFDLSGKTCDQVELEDRAFCGLTEAGKILYGSPGDGFDGQSEVIKVNYCPICGRKLS